MLKTILKLFPILMLTFQLKCLATSVTTDPIEPNSQGTRLESSPKRIQEPTFPYPYKEEEVIFLNKKDNVRLSGTLTYPNGEGPFPAVIMIQGSAPLDRNSSMFGHKLFLVWTDYLTRQGIAVLRFDKRSAGKSTGDYNTSTIEDFARDTIAGLEYLKKHDEIDTRHIGLIGHSEGGMTANLVAANSSDISFVVLMAAPCINWEQLIPEQEAALKRIDGVSEETISKSQKIRLKVFELLKIERNRETAEIKLRELLTQELNKLSTTEKQTIETYHGSLENQVQLFNSAWYRYNLTYDPLIILKKLRIPILALYAKLDLVVSPTQNLVLIEKALQEINHQNYTVMELPSLNHGFQTCQTGSVTECANIEETTSPKALRIMADWILDLWQ
jgi:hypothetical protein